MSAEEPQQAVAAINEGALIAGRYRLVRQMAAGGMGTVWLARDDKLGRDVAVKIMAQALVSHSELLARFEREAKAVAQLRSTHVVEVYDYGFNEELPFMVMELLEGESLRTRLRRLGRMNLRDTAIVADQISKGLKAAHTAGLVHRDLKPSNVFIATRDDVEIVKLLDFGVVKAVDQDGHSDMTTSGTLLGTPQYMSPEQVRARKAVDSRSDLWSLAVIVFRMLTGINPFRGESVGDAALRICSDELPRVGDYCDDLPSTLDRFFGRAFARDPDHRFQSADELSSNFRAVCAESLSGLAPPPAALAGAAAARGERPPVFPTPQALPPPLAPGQTRPVASATPPPVVRRVGDPVVQEAPTPISISGFGSLSGQSAGIPPSVTPAPTPTPYSSPYGAMPSHTPLPHIGPPMGAPGGAAPVAGPLAPPGFEPATTKIGAELRAAYLQPNAGGPPSGGGLAAQASIPGTNIPRPFVEPSLLIRPMSPSVQLLQSARKLGAAAQRAIQPLKQRLLQLRSPMPLVVATVVTLFVGALLAIVLLSPTDKTKTPAPAARITSRFYNPAWTRVPSEAPPDTATADTTSPQASPSATESSGPSMAPPEATGTDTAPGKHGKTDAGKTQKPRPKWF